MYADKNIIENAVNSKDHTTLVAAVKAAGLVDTLPGRARSPSSPRPTQPSPSCQGTVENLLMPENKDQLTKILTCHVVAAKALSNAIQKMARPTAAPIKTVGGCKLTAG